jgi:hypothetical protein
MFDSERGKMGSAIEKLWRIWDAPDDEFQQAYDDARTAVATFTSSVDRRLMDPKRRRPKQLEHAG